MTIALAVILIIFSVFLHELGHAIYMQKYGIPIKTFSIGLPFPLKITFSTPKILNGATLQFTPLLLGAYVEATVEGAEKTKELSYFKQADIYAAGPLANFLFTALLLAGIFFYSNIAKAPEASIQEAFLDTKFLIALGAFFAFYFGRTLFSRFLMPILGVTLLFVTIWLITKDPTGSIMGPVGIGKAIGDSAVTYSRAIYIGAVISGAIGATNILPLCPLDGGQTVRTLLEKTGFVHISKVFTKVTQVMFIGLIILAFSSDFLSFL